MEPVPVEVPAADDDECHAHGHVLLRAKPNSEPPVFEVADLLLGNMADAPGEQLCFSKLLVLLCMFNGYGQ